MALAGLVNVKIKRIPTKLSVYLGHIVFCIAFVLLVSAGCTPPPPPGPGPGLPDDIQLEHYYMLTSAIDDKNKINAFMALDLLEDDISRWYAEKLIETTAITDMETLTEAVEKEKWDAAQKILDDLVAKYRPNAE